MKDILAELEARRETARAGGGERRVAAQHAQVCTVSQVSAIPDHRVLGIRSSQLISASGSLATWATYHWANPLTQPDRVP